MGKMQREKGARFERECVKQLNFHDIVAKRVPLSGATWLKGDIIALPSCIFCPMYFSNISTSETCDSIFSLSIYFWYYNTP